MKGKQKANRFAQQVLDHIRDNPGVSKQRLRKMLLVSRDVLALALRKLSNAGLTGVVYGDVNRSHYFLAELVEGSKYTDRFAFLQARRAVIEFIQRTVEAETPKIEACGYTPADQLLLRQAAEWLSKELTKLNESLEGSKS